MVLSLAAMHQVVLTLARKTLIRLAQQAKPVLIGVYVEVAVVLLLVRVFGAKGIK